MEELIGQAAELAEKARQRPRRRATPTNGRTAERFELYTSVLVTPVELDQLVRVPPNRQVAYQRPAVSGEANLRLVDRQRHSLRGLRSPT